jgi:hypothetical protein
MNTAPIVAAEAACALDTRPTPMTALRRHCVDCSGEALQ